MQLLRKVLQNHSKYCLSKVAKLQREPVYLKMDCVMGEIFQNSLSMENVGVVSCFSCAV